ncbi:uncharacterized protein [Centroberyx affinis]|uniref:uncharacterized protein n=1 Tax=Centroberyx affinis TaxID=166261 RepID=UPI003A5C6684
MGGPKALAQVLLLSTIVCTSTLIAATSTTRSSRTYENRTTNNATAPNTTYQGTCRPVNLKDVTSTISDAVDTLTGKLSCDRGNGTSLPQDKSRMLEQNLRRIVESTLNVFFNLGTNQSESNVLDIFGVLDSLSLGNHSDPQFIRLWFSIKMAPLLPYVDKNFLSQLSSQNFSCSSFQELIKGMSDELVTAVRVDRRLIYTDFIKVYLFRKNSPDPGCTANVEGSEEWLLTNFGEFSSFASLEDLKKINNNFSATEVVEHLSPNQKAELILDPDSSALDNETIVRDVFSSLTESPDEEQLDQFFETFCRLAMQVNA